MPAIDREPPSRSVAYRHEIFSEAVLKSAEQGYFAVVGNLVGKIPNAWLRELTASEGKLSALMAANEDTNAEYHSKKAFNTTYQQFYDDIDRAIEASPAVDSDALEALRHVDEASQGVDGTQEHLAGYLIPVYVELRMMGYSDYDIVQ